MPLFLALAAAGCSKHEPAAAGQNAAPTASQETTATPGAASQRGAPVALPAQPVVVPENADVSATLGQLSLELRKYVLRTRSVPKDFEEFAAKSQARIPPPPAGKKYAIKDQTVVLVNR